LVGGDGVEDSQPPLTQPDDSPAATDATTADPEDGAPQRPSVADLIRAVKASDTLVLGHIHGRDFKTFIDANGIPYEYEGGYSPDFRFYFREPLCGVFRVQVDGASGNVNNRTCYADDYTNSTLRDQDQTQLVGELTKTWGRPTKSTYEDKVMDLGLSVQWGQDWERWKSVVGDSGGDDLMTTMRGCAIFRSSGCAAEVHHQTLALLEAALALHVEAPPPQ